VLHRVSDIQDVELLESPLAVSSESIIIPLETIQVDLPNNPLDTSCVTSCSSCCFRVALKEYTELALELVRLFVRSRHLPK
jgi:hypothetical protein